MTASHDKLQLLQQAHQLTQNMLSLAKQQKWEELQKLKKQRQVLLNDIFPLNDDDSEMETFSIALQTLIDTNQALIAHCQEGKHSLQLQMRDAKFTKKAVTAYQSN